MTETERLAQALDILPAEDLDGLTRMAAAALLRAQAAEIEAALPIVREFARANPKHYWRGTVQDPLGAHAWLARNDPDAAIGAARQS